MAKSIDIARALKDKKYFNSLPPEQQAQVQSANPVGIVHLEDSDLETVSGGLEGGAATEVTTTTGAGTCGCNGPEDLKQDVVIVCVC